MRTPQDRQHDKLAPADRARIYDAHIQHNTGAHPVGLLTAREHIGALVVLRRQHVLLTWCCHDVAGVHTTLVRDSSPPPVQGHTNTTLWHYKQIDDRFDVSILRERTIPLASCRHVDANHLCALQIAFMRPAPADTSGGHNRRSPTHFILRSVATPIDCNNGR